MTTEEKARAYDEAITTAKRIISENCSEVEKLCLKCVFPELAESEDERIRKELVEYHKQQFEKNRDQEVGLFHKEAIAYLEKQKEQKEQKVDIDKLRRDLYQSGYNDGYQHGREDEQKEQKPVDYEAELKKCKDNPLYFYDKYVTVKLKPAKWSDEDKIQLTNILIMLKEYLIHHYSKDDVNKSVDWLESLPKRFNLQPKQEWSEEDQKSLNRAINICISDFGEESETARFLKSLPERFNVEPKLKWSEEDRHAIENCEYAIKKTFKRRANPHRIETLNWLKSLPLKLKKENKEWKHYIWTTNLRFDFTALIKYDNTDNYEIVQAGNRPKQEKNGIYILIKDIKSQPYWKPSEEQMKALKLARSFVVDDFSENPTLSEILKTLQEQLEKLM